MSDLSALLDIVLRDFVGTPVEDVPTRIVLADSATAQDLALDPVLQGCVDPDEPWLVLRVADNITTRDPDLDEQEILVEAASYLQDYVMDQWSRPWPETGQGPPRVLEPFLAPDHTAAWGDPRRGVVWCAVGDLLQHRER